MASSLVLEKMNVGTFRFLSAAWSSIIDVIGSKMSPKICENSSRSPLNPVSVRMAAKKLFLRHQAGFVAEEQGRLADEFMDGLRRDCAARRKVARGDGVIEIQQHFAEIKDDNLRGEYSCAECHISRRPAMAWVRVNSSANSSPLPAGRPWAMRVTFTPGRASRFAR